MRVFYDYLPVHEGVKRENRCHEDAGKRKAKSSVEARMRHDEIRAIHKPENFHPGIRRVGGEQGANSPQL